MALVGILVVPGAAVAQRLGEVPDVFDGVTVDELLGSEIPRDIEFTDATGAAITTGQLFDGQTPVLINFVYHTCPMLCSLLLENLTSSLEALALEIGDDFRVVTVSMSPMDGPDVAARAKEKYAGQLAAAGRGRALEGWQFLTGNEAAIRSLADAVGFRFKWVEEQAEYAHAAALMFMSGEGTLTRVLYGLQYPVDDLKLAIVEAADGEVGTALDRFILYCFQYDQEANAYVLHAVNLMKLGGLLTLLVIGLMLVRFWRREGSQPNVRSMTLATNVKADGR